MRYPLAILLRMIGSLRSRVRRCRGSIRSTSVSSGNMRVVVGSKPDADAGTMNGFMAFIDARDKSTSRYNMLLQAFGDTAEEALMNLEANIKSQEGQCNTN